MKDDDLSLWGRFIEGIKPLRDRKVAPAKKPSLDRPAVQKNNKNIFPVYTPAPEKNIQQPITDNLLDRRTLDRLKKGKMPIEATIDLHDKTQDQAYNALHSFVSRAFHAQMRCVLVITGKGNRRAQSDDVYYSSRQEGVGILKSRLPEWVAQSPMNDMVLRCQPAHRNHGGGGAFYLYLKRQRP